MTPSEHLQHRRLVLVVEDQEINQGILEFILEDDYDIIFANNGVEALEAIQTHLDDLSIVLLDLIMPVMDGFEVLDVVHADERMKGIPIIVMTSEEDAELRALQLGAADFITKPFDAHEVIRARIARIIELSERRQLIRAASYDSLTGLYVRSFFFEYVEQIKRYQKDLKMDAVAINIDRFHFINDINGWEFGNVVLAELGHQIASFLEGTQGIASRLEADSFLIFCPQQSAEQYSDLLTHFEEGLNHLPNHVNIRLRMGVCPHDGSMSALAMFDRAKVACNMVRGQSSHLMVYDEQMHLRDMHHQRLLNELPHAIENQDFKVYYQPKYVIQHDPPLLTSAEALIRWVHPELGMISPGEFIPLFESNGLINVLDGYVREEVARQMAQWRNELGVTIPISVNLSRAEILDPSLEEGLDRLMVDNGLNPTDMKLEVTESAYAEDSERLIEVVKRLREQGYQIEMDDFGSGYSSLNMLLALPIDVLKMDMKFVRNIEEDERAMRLVEMILDISQYMDVPVVAEGVETEAQMQLLRDAGCDIVQGYYFSRPLPADEFTALIVKELERGGVRK